MAHYEVPEHGIEDTTIVFDRAEGRQVMRLNGLVTLPPGSLVELYQAPNVHGTAVVDQVRLCAAAGDVGVYVCLDVTVQSGWWEAVDPDAYA